MASDKIHKNFYFKDVSLYEPNSMYGKALRELCTFTQKGKNQHDDAADGLAMLEEMTKSLGISKAQIMERFF